MSDPITPRLAEAGSVLIVRETTADAARARISAGRAAGLPLSRSPSPHRRR